MVNIQNHISKISKKILWLSIFAWSILSASKLKTLPVQEGTESGEIVFDLRKGFDFPGATIRHFKLQKESDRLQRLPFELSSTMPRTANSRFGDSRAPVGSAFDLAVQVLPIECSQNYDEKEV